MISLKDKALLFPKKPGVYLFKNSDSKVLYIGKAKDLKKRILDYFNGRDLRSQIPTMLKQAKELEYLELKNEKDALILENQLIKQYKPKYNVLLKDDKTYKSIKITLSHSYPAIKKVRKYKDNQVDLFFGPYTSSRQVNETVRLLIRIFQLRDCSDKEFRRRKKPCLKYDIALCSGPCVGLIQKEKYDSNIKSAISLLLGRKKRALSEIKKKIKDLSDELNFEEAAKWHEMLRSLEETSQEKKGLKHFLKDAHVFGSFRTKDSTVIQRVIIKRGQIVSNDLNFYDYKEFGDVIQVQKLYELVIRTYFEKVEIIPDEFWLDIEPESKNLLEDILSDKKNKKVRVIVPKRGHKRQLIELSINNATSKYTLLKQENSEKKRFEKNFNRVFKLLETPELIECFDISHHGGNTIVGAKVCFENFKKNTDLYRKYIIRESQVGDDLKSLYEVLKRRVRDGIEKSNLPQFILIDGGKGQLKVLEKVLNENKLIDKVFAASIAKESHSKNSFDRIFILNRQNHLPLKRNDKVLLKLMEIRDEAHRFAKKFHEEKYLKEIIPKKT